MNVARRQIRRQSGAGSWLSALDSYERTDPWELGEFTCRVVVWRYPKRFFSPEVLCILEEGAWKLIGGRRFPGESLRACAVREPCEEVGLCLDPEDLQPEFMYIPAGRKVAGWHKTAIYSYRVWGAVNFASREPQIYDVRWLQLLNLPVSGNPVGGAVLSLSHCEYLERVFRGRFGTNRGFSCSQRGVGTESARYS